ncbi:MAG: Fe-S cluster assembly protein SufB, partial [Mucinivorans sp.]
MEEKEILKDITQGAYQYGFTSDFASDSLAKGLSEDVVRLISAKKKEPQWLLDFRLSAYKQWLTMKMPTWAHLEVPKIDYQDIIYYSEPRKPKVFQEGDQIDPALVATFDKLGIPLAEQKALGGYAVDAVIDSVSVKTTFSSMLAEQGIIFCSFSEAVQNHPDLVRRYMASVVPPTDNFFAALNSAVFSD